MGGRKKSAPSGRKKDKKGASSGRSATASSSASGQAAPAQPPSSGSLFSKHLAQRVSPPPEQSTMEKSSSQRRSAMAESSSLGRPATEMSAPAVGPVIPSVIEYLVKKGYNRTEQMLRQESAHVDKDGRPIQNHIEELGNIKYTRGFKLLSAWIEQNLDVYKFELRRLLWPIFVYSYLDLIINDAVNDGEMFFREFSPEFGQVHSDELRVFETLKLRSQVFENSIAKLYRETKYRIPLNKQVYFNLLTFLESNANSGGTVIIYILQTYCEVHEVERGPMDQFSFDAIVNMGRGVSHEGEDLQEGIPGAFTGVSNKDITDHTAALKLGPMPMEPDLAGDVRAELEKEDEDHPPPPGTSSLVEEFDRIVKREDSADGPTRGELPLPQSRQRDVVMEVQKVKENRDRFRIDSAADMKSGVAPGVTICMFTFHNTLDSLTCIQFSDDNNLVAVGTQESYIRVWNIHGDPLKSILPSAQNDPPASSRRLIGHSAPVFEVSFSPAIDGPENPGPDTAPTNSRYLLSSSSDGTVRLWSLETWTCLIVYKGHDGPVWQVKWGPFGHYFASCGRDRTVRVWVMDHISPVRIMVGHDTSVNQVAWHPNGAYVFSASDQADKTIRMWSVQTGECVRIFTGHTDTLSALECSPNGKILASADHSGTIFLWNIEESKQIKRCRGHKSAIWSLSFSAESTVLCSGSQDGTVRAWDVAVPADPHKIDRNSEIVATGGQADATRINAGTQPAAPATGGAKKKGKDTQITPDQISAFPTKKSPVYKVRFTRMNLIVAGGPFLP